MRHLFALGFAASVAMGLYGAPARAWSDTHYGYVNLYNDTLAPVNPPNLCNVVGNGTTVLGINLDTTTGTVGMCSVYKCLNLKTSINTVVIKTGVNYSYDVVHRNMTTYQEHGNSAWDSTCMAVFGTSPWETVNGAARGSLKKLIEHFDGAPGRTINFVMELGNEPQQDFGLPAKLSTWTTGTYYGVPGSDMGSDPRDPDTVAAHYKRTASLLKTNHGLTNLHVMPALGNACTGQADCIPFCETGVDCVNNKLWYVKKLADTRGVCNTPDVWGCSIHRYFDLAPDGFASGPNHFHQLVNWAVQNVASIPRLGITEQGINDSGASNLTNYRKEDCYLRKWTKSTSSATSCTSIDTSTAPNGLPDPQCSLSHPACYHDATQVARRCHGGWPQRIRFALTFLTCPENCGYGSYSIDSTAEQYPSATAATDCSTL
jgi:hypothetical protein